MLVFSRLWRQRMDHLRDLGRRFVRFGLRRGCGRRNWTGKLRLWYVLQTFLFFVPPSLSLRAIPFPLFSFQHSLLPLALRTFRLKACLFFALTLFSRGFLKYPV